MNKLMIYRIAGFITDLLLFFFIAYTTLCYVAIGSAESDLTTPIVRFIIALLAAAALYDLSFHFKYLINTEEWRKKREERRKTN